MTQRLNILDMHYLAAVCGYRFLDADYVGMNHPHTWECARGHRWKARPANIGKGSRCPRCTRRTGAELFDLVCKIAEDRGGTCISHTYVNATTKLMFRCKDGHIFSATAGSIYIARGRATKGTWCPECYRKNRTAIQFGSRDWLGELQAVARQRGGECLATQYVNNHTKMPFRCADGHEWNATSNDIKRGFWCPGCVNKTEALVRQFFECVFDAPFPNTSPAWLQRAGHPRRILDGYNEVLGMAFEYHGIQHRKHTKHFHERRGEKTLAMQLERDRYVRETCAAHGVRLIEIEPLRDGYTKEALTVHLVMHCEAALGGKIAAEAVERFLHLPASVSKLKEIRDIAAAKGGECLEAKYIGINSKMHFRCAKGHEFAAIPKTIRKGHWCPVCAGCRVASPLEDIRRIAVSRGGECLSDQYVNQKAKLRFRCGEGHEWIAAAGSIKWGQTWCPYCTGNRIADPMKEIQTIAEKRGGRCLSMEYKNSAQKLLFQCKRGHSFEMRCSAVKRGQWCPYCKGVDAGNRQRNPNGLMEMQGIAKSKGGECLSTEYINVGTKLRFRCARGARMGGRTQKCQERVMVPNLSFRKRQAFHMIYSEPKR